MQEKFTQVLPNNWNGSFPFTNDSDDEFIFPWGKKAYLFPARKTVDMMKMNFNATPLEVQQIRKFAAKQWAEREFFRGEAARKMQSLEKDENGFAKMWDYKAARTYSENDLKNEILRCLTPLPEGTALVGEAEIINTESLLHKDMTGKFMTPPIENHAASVDPSGILIN